MNIIKTCTNLARPQLLSIFFLNVTAGLPLALLLSALKASLFDQGLSIVAIGFTSLLSLPYSLKFIWSPLVDSLEIPYLTRKLGRFRSWILIAQLLLFLAIITLGFLSKNSLESLAMIMVCCFVIAFVSATQDIAIDAYRIKALPPEDQGIAAAVSIYGYRLGILIAGAGALYLADRVSWELVYYLLASIMLLGMFTTILSGEKIELIKKNAPNLIIWVRESVLKPFGDFIRRPGWHFMLIFVVCFKLGEAFAGILTLPFLLDIGFTKTEIATIVKTFGLFATLFGALLGGLSVRGFGMIKSLWIAALLQTFSNLGYYYQSLIGHDTITLYWVIFIENASGGIGDAVLVAYLSSLCNIAFTATQYALLSSLASLGRAIFSSCAGLFVKYLGWADFFLVSLLVSLPSILLLFFLRKKVISK